MAPNAFPRCLEKLGICKGQGLFPAFCRNGSIVELTPALLYALKHLLPRASHFPRFLFRVCCAGGALGCCCSYSSSLDRLLTHHQQSPRLCTYRFRCRCLVDSEFASAGLAKPPSFPVLLLLAHSATPQSNGYHQCFCQLCHCCCSAHRGQQARACQGESTTSFSWS
jgi:hypothetical protein